MSRIDHGTRSRWAACCVAAALALTGCAGKKQSDYVPRQMITTQEGYEQGLAQIDAGDYRKARQTLERIEFDRETRAQYEPLVRLAIADATYFLGDATALIEARALYTEFVTLYGDHPRAPYAQLQAGMCSIGQALSPAKDQGQTLLAIEEFRQTGVRFPDSPYASLAEQQIRIAQDGVAEHDFLVGRFYVKRKRFDAGSERFRKILTSYPEYEQRDKIYYWLGLALVRGGNLAEGRLYLEKLAEDYPDSPWTSEAHKILAKAEAEPVPAAEPRS